MWSTCPPTSTRDSTTSSGAGARRTDTCRAECAYTMRPALVCSWGRSCCACPGRANGLLALAAACNRTGGAVNWTSCGGGGGRAAGGRRMLCCVQSAQFTWLRVCVVRLGGCPADMHGLSDVIGVLTASCAPCMLCVLTHPSFLFATRCLIARRLAAQPAVLYQQ
jgi:hypothetical protein